ncbi:glycosyltransferase family 2 protein [Bacteroides gallinaceum]|uniref:glycosyltransferase family 2 protein n=1 Tax=Bacteroides gallinaceum TaxID=1462571 RepID=UPI001EF5E72F|nr:glycosyltransferase family 2 protein [Bacteroides gallinaceum]
MIISLIQTSQNRKVELKRFINSLNHQISVDFSKIQFIFIDQGNNCEIFNDLDKRIDFTYIKYKPCSLSHARNIGLSHVKGEYIGFPDDDCWYEKDTLMRVVSLFKQNYVGVIARGTDENGITINKSPRNSQIISLYSHCGAISYTIFLKYITGFFFDENIGVGSPYRLSSGEETDFLIRSIRKLGNNILYDNHIIVHHPKNKCGNFINTEIKQYEYARGWGYLLRKYRYPLREYIKSFIRPIGGIVLSVLTLNPKKAYHSYLIIKGRIEGFFFKIN